MTRHHWSELSLDVIRTVRTEGAATALRRLHDTRAPLDDGRYHHTRAVFLVWAAERLVNAGLSDTAALWHPLLDPDSPEAWWPAEVLAGHAARDGFVEPVGLLAGEPVPAPPEAALVG